MPRHLHGWVMPPRPEYRVNIVDLVADPPVIVTKDGQRFEVTRERALEFAAQLMRQNEDDR